MKDSLDKYGSRKYQFLYMLGGTRLQKVHFLKSVSDCRIFIYHRKVSQNKNKNTFFFLILPLQKQNSFIKVQKQPKSNSHFEYKEMQNSTKSYFVNNSSYNLVQNSEICNMASIDL